MRNKKLLVVLAILIPVLLIGAYAFVVFGQDRKNGFVRDIRDGMATKVGDLASEVRLIGVAGSDAHQIYFTPDEPHRIVVMDKQDRQLQYYYTDVPDDKWIKYSYSMQVDGPDTVTVFAGNLPAIFKVSIHDRWPTDKMEVRSKHYNAAVRYAGDGYFIREYSAAHKDYTVAKVDATGTIIGREDGASFLTHDNGMSSQAHMVYSREHQRLLLVYKLSNQIRCLDTSLHLLYAAHSIDTITTPTMKETIVEQKNTKIGTMNKPPQYTNYAVAVSGQYLYSYSKLRGDNERRSDDIALDVYNISDGSYQYSIRLPGSSKTGLSNIGVSDDLLITIDASNRKVSLYRLQLADEDTRHTAAWQP